jgi:hypothetical protein
MITSRAFIDKYVQLPLAREQTSIIEKLHGFGRREKAACRK